MEMGESMKLPLWFWIAAGLFLLWNATGIFFFYTQLTMSYAEMVKTMGKPQADCFAMMPHWQWWAYGIAVWSGTFAAVALLLRRAWSQLLFLISLVAVVVQYGYSFGVAKIQHILGWSALPFPLFIIAMAAAGFWLAGFAKKRGWVL
jgi:hypothetical protein